MFGFGRKKKVRIEQPLLIAMRDQDPNGPMAVHIDPSQLGSAQEAGLVLADFAKHFSNALAEYDLAESPEQAMEQIRLLFDAELDNPTQDAEGGLVQ